MDKKKVFASFHIVLIYRYFELFRYALNRLFEQMTTVYFIF